MNETIYSFSLVALLSLMFFMGFSSMFMHLPENKKSRSFLQSCRLMGAALIVLAINCTLHLVFSIRMRDSVIAILVNLSTYFICYWLFSCALMTLLDKTYLTRKRFLYHFVLWLLFLTVSTLLIFIPDGSFTRIGIVVLLAFCLIAYGVFLAARLLKTYHKSLRLFENTHSDDIGSYIRWLSIFTYLAILFGISCGILTFLPDRFVFIWLLSAALFCIYLYRCYQNYIFFYDRVEDALMEDEEDMSSEPVDEPQLATEAVPSIPEYHSDLSRRISEWIEGKGYTRPGITLNDLSSALGTNRTYLSEYINTVFRKSFRDWISDLRIDYAKGFMDSNPQARIQEVSETSGFLSISHFSRTFSEREGCSPSQWRKDRQTGQ